jgi:hypothetical protein
MIRGPGVPKARVAELVGITDILPSLLKLNGYSLANDIDGQLPTILGGNTPRDFTLSEIKFAGAPYEASIKDEEFDFYLKTKNLVADSGAFDLDPFRTELFLKGTWANDVSAHYPEIVIRYTANSWLRWSAC